MTRKTADCYSAVFKYIEETIKFELKPAEFMTDFEDGMRLAIKKRWPKSVVRGCWFHLCRAVKKRARKLRLNKIKSKYAKMIRKMLMCIPLLPTDDIDEGYRGIKKFAKKHRLSKRFAPLFNYFERYWLNQV